MRIGEVAEAADVNVQTVRYYERRGLLEDPPRTAAGYRQYQPEVVHRIRFIRHAQDLGFTLNEIDELLELRVDESGRCSQVEARARAKRDEVRVDESGRCSQVEARARAKRDEVRRKISELERMEAVLADLVASCRARARTDDCPILAALEHDGEGDPGHDTVPGGSR